LKIELSHDTLAKTVYERASANDRMRLRVLNLLKVKQQLYEADHALLTADEVKAIVPFEEQLDLTVEERSFLNRSKVMARKNLIIFIVGSGIATFLVVGILLWFVFYYRNTSAELEASNERFKSSELALEAVNEDLEIKLAELRTKDSIHVILLDRIGDDEQIIKMTNRELQDALTELRIANDALEASKRALERERDRLKQDKAGLTQELTKQVKIANEVIRTRAQLSAVDKSQKLSQNALQLLQGGNVSEADYKEAFRLARYAWELSNSNSQAMDVLNTIRNKKLNRSNGGFLEREQPKNTYTYRNIEKIIQQVDARYKYGKLSEKEAQQLLNR
jgi:hypothetical protein